MENSNYLGNEKVGKLLRQFSIPCICSLIISCLYNIVDQIFVGNMVGYVANGATGIIFPITVVGWGMSLFFGDGVAASLSVSLGRNETQNIHRSVGNGLLWTFVSGIAIIAISYICGDNLLWLIGATNENIQMAHNYGFIIYAMMPLAMVQNALAAIIRADGSPRYSMLAMIVGAVINIVGDPICISIWGIKGAAIATVLAQIIAFVICWIYMIKRYELLRLSGDDFKEPQPQMIQSMLSAGLSMGFMSSLINIGSLTLQTAINKLGQNIIVAHTAARKISEMFMIMFTVFGQTMATYCGQNLGAGRIDRIKKGIGLAILYTCIWCSFTIVASYTIGDWLVYMVTGSKNAEVLKNATNYLKFDTLFYFVTAVICVVRNAMQGLGDHITPLVSSSLEMIGKIVIAATLVPWFGYTGVIVAEPLVWFIMVIPLLIQIFRMPVLKNNILTKS